MRLLCGADLSEHDVATAGNQPGVGATDPRRELTPAVATPARPALRPPIASRMASIGRLRSVSNPRHQIRRGDR